MPSTLFLNSQTAFRIVSIISSFFSFSVVLTGILFQRINMRVFMHILWFISLSDMLSSIASAWGYPRDDTILCTSQAIVVSIFLKASWLWTNVLCFQLYSVAMYGELALTKTKMHLIVWGITLLTSFLPLITAEFGRQNPGTNQLVEWCLIKDESQQMYLLWIFVDWFVIAIGCFLTSLYFQVRIWWKYRNLGGVSAHNHIALIFKTLYLYPLSMVCTWGPELSVGIYLYAADDGRTPHDVSSGYQTLLLTVVGCLAMSSGTVLAIIFFCKSPEVRARWYNLLIAGGDDTEKSIMITDHDFDEVPALRKENADVISKRNLLSSSNYSTEHNSEFCGQDQNGLRRQSSWTGFGV